MFYSSIAGQRTVYKHKSAGSINTNNPLMHVIHTYNILCRGQHMREFLSTRSCVGT
jgi:hypothetical protein